MSPRTCCRSGPTFRQTTRKLRKPDKWLQREGFDLRGFNIVRRDRFRVARKAQLIPATPGVGSARTIPRRLRFVPWSFSVGRSFLVLVLFGGVVWRNKSFSDERADLKISLASSIIERSESRSLSSRLSSSGIDTPPRSRLATVLPIAL